LASLIFSNIKSELRAKKKICAYFGLKRGGFRILESWLQHFTVLRNICAHHSRLWDRTIRQEPRFAAELSSPWVKSFHDSRKVYVSLCLLAWLHHKLNPADEFRSRLSVLLDQYEHIPLDRMGFPLHWNEEELWKGYF
jgi:abortive infection bacteriophage resistance protein